MRKKKLIKSSNRADEFDFFVKTDLRSYRGKYIAILGRKIVASGENAKEVWQQARSRYPHKIPTLAKLPRQETLSKKCRRY